MEQKGIKSETQSQIPDVFIKNQALQNQIQYLKGQLDKAVIVDEKAKSNYDKLLKQRDFHKMHHQRVQKQKKKLNVDIQKLKNIYMQQQSKYQQLNQKYSHAMIQKMLLKLDKSVLSKTFKGHILEISVLSMHSKKCIIATGSDDYTWKLWTIPQGQLILSSQGHKDWVIGIDFHLKGLHLVLLLQIVQLKFGILQIFLVLILLRTIFSPYRVQHFMIWEISQQVGVLIKQLKLFLQQNQEILLEDILIQQIRFYFNHFLKQQQQLMLIKLSVYEI